MGWVFFTGVNNPDDVVPLTGAEALNACTYVLKG